MDYVGILKRIAPFDLLGADVLASVVPRLELKKFRKGTYIFRQDEPSLDALFLIVSGVAEIIVTNDKGSDSVIGFRRPFEFFGETVILTGKNYPASVRAIEDLQCLVLHKADFEELLQRDVRFTGFFSQILAERLRELFHEVVQEQSYEAYGMESQPFRKRAYDIMTAPVITCFTFDKVPVIAKKMVDHNISALVVLDKKKIPVGLITETDLVAKVLTASCPIQGEIIAESIMSPLFSVPPDAYFYQVLVNMVKNQIKHVAVLEDTKLMGIVTVRDLVKSRSTGALTIVAGIETESTVERLCKVAGEVDKVLTALVAEKASVPEIFEVMTELNDRLTRRVIALSEKAMEDEGHGPAPVPYCFLTMGSGGRKEQTLRTDQDNAIIYGDVTAKAKGSVDKYFALLAEKIIEGLAACGFAYCKGNVMATNPLWCKPLKEWEEMVTHWIFEPQSEILRLFTIFLDFRPVYGDKSLSARLRDLVIRNFRQSPIVLHFLAKDDLAHHVPLGFFKQFITERSGRHKDEIDLKRSACVHVVDCARLFALQAGITETGTLERIQQLQEKEILSPEDAELYLAAYESLMMFRIRENLRKSSQGLDPDNYINPYKLSKREQSVLREAFLAVTRMQNFTGSYFRVEGY